VFCLTISVYRIHSRLFNFHFPAILISPAN